ncbi:hypothetical protein LSAT2_030169 [Lamellibrachia satsuma]|nr:hypothetical protein LSAT2_030169 [Lamellibrachia satsuma]
MTTRPCSGETGDSDTPCLRNARRTQMSAAIGRSFVQCADDSTGRIQEIGHSTWRRLGQGQFAGQRHPPICEDTFSFRFVLASNDIARVIGTRHL